MGSLFASNLIPSVRATPARWQCPCVTSDVFSGDSFFPRRVKKQICYSHIISRSKRSVYQDFQDFAKPSQILPATQVTTYSMHLPEEIVSSLELDQSTSLYLVELCTSRDFGSCLRDLNAAIIICLIDDSGMSILQRISAISHTENTKMSECIHFQRGCVDTVTFKGSKLEKIAAVWIGLESGSWRVDGIDLKVINGPTHSSSNGVEHVNFSGIQYKFDVNNIQLGDGGLSVIELRPTVVSQLSSLNSSPETRFSNTKLLKEGSMAEYADLKFSLLLYDFILIVVGATILTVSSNEMNTYSFIAGGIGGFLYLLLLQRSVDGLSVPLSSSEEDDNYGGGLKGSLMTFVSVIFASAILSKYWIGAQGVVFSSSEIFVGVAGFLMCKIAVVLAAFKPIQIGIKDDRFE